MSASPQVSPLPSQPAWTAKTYAPLVIDFTFKRVFATEEHKHLLISLIDTFLGEYLEAPIKDVAVLNTTQMAKTRRKRSSVFDLHCEDTLGHRFVVEMQLAKQEHFFERLVFYASQCVTGLVRKGGMNFNFPKVYSLGFLNFIPDEEAGTKNLVRHIGFVDLKNRKKEFPKVHISYVMLQRFHKRPEKCETTQDIWLYLFRHLHEMEKIPPKFRKKWLKDLFSTAKIANFTEQELRNYEESMKAYWDYKNTLAYAKKEGVQEGLKEGLRKGEARGKAQGKLAAMLDMAKAMLADHKPLSEIMRYTGLKRQQLAVL
jgi:predicted transposase/invertase (TIGR01784 family)